MRCCFLVSLSVDWLQAEEPEDDDVNLANYMDLEDDMECKSAASWNPKFQFEAGSDRSEEHTSELQSRPHISYAVFCLKKKKKKKQQ